MPCTIYSHLTNDELITLCDQRNVARSPLMAELLDRLDQYREDTEELNDLLEENAKLELVAAGSNTLEDLDDQEDVEPDSLLAKMIAMVKRCVLNAQPEVPTIAQCPICEAKI